MSKKTTPYLFVYGTLMSQSKHPMAVRLRQCAKLIGPATIAGRLYDLGEYPGATLSANMRDKIHGEVFRLTAPSQILPILDRYEGATPHHPQPYLYSREITEARLANGQRLPAWVYIMIRAHAKLKPIANGRYLPQSK